MMLPKGTSSNLAEALFNVRKIENNLVKREFKFLDRDRNKIHMQFDRHKETFLQLTRQRHETWYQHDQHFREGIRKEKDSHEKRKERQRQQMLLSLYPDYASKDYTPYQAIDDDGSALPPIKTSPAAKANVAKTAEPMTKVERHTYQVLRASQKLLDESAARPRYMFSLERPRSTRRKNQLSSSPRISRSNPLPKTPVLTPRLAPSRNDEYDRLVDESLQHETFGEFVDHFVKFRPEFCEQFAVIHEENKRQQAVEKLRELNEIQAKTQDDRYHHLLATLTDPRSEQQQRTTVDD